MEIWIRSQDRKGLIKVNSVDINSYLCSIIVNGESTIGFYNTEERALEVLDEIQNAIENEGIKKEEYEYTSGCYLTIKKNVYEMPKE